jgi:hypothetical protein
MRAKQDKKGIYDFDALVVEPRLARVGGEVVDVSVIPVAVTLAMSKYQSRTREEIEAEAEADPEAGYQKILQLVSDVCIRSNPKFTVEFLMDNLDTARFSAFVQFVLYPVKETEEPGDEGNPTTDEDS